MGGQALDLRRSAQIVWRLKWLVAAFIVLGFLGGVAYTAVSPAVYQSTAVVAIPQSISIASQAAVVTSPPVLVPALNGVDRGVPLNTLRNRVFAMLETEFVRSRNMILRVTAQRELLATNRVMARSIQLRNPYVDPMSLIQVELLRRKHQGQGLHELEYPLGATINGIAAGLHNTG